MQEIGRRSSQRETSGVPRRLDLIEIHQRCSLQDRPQCARWTPRPVPSYACTRVMNEGHITKGRERFKVWWVRCHYGNSARLRGREASPACKGGRAVWRRPPGGPGFACVPS